MEKINVIFPGTAPRTNIIAGNIPSEGDPVVVTSRTSSFNVATDMSFQLRSGGTYRLECFADYAVWAVSSDTVTDHRVGVNIRHSGTFLNAQPIEAECTPSHGVFTFTAPRDAAAVIYIASLTRKAAGQQTRLWGFTVYDMDEVPANKIYVTVTADAVHAAELMASDHVTLSWRSKTWMSFPTGMHIFLGTDKYTLLEPYQPEQESEVLYRYEPRFHAEPFTWGKYPFFLYTPQSGGAVLREPSWTLTDSPQNFMNLIADAISRETGAQWTVQTEDPTAYEQAAATLTFDNTDILSALNAVAEAFATEWWTDKETKTIHLSTAMISRTPSEPFYPLIVGSNVSVPSISDRKADEYFNRYYVFGSTRNILQDTPSAASNTIVNRRLTLDPDLYPEGYIDAEQNPEHIYSKVLHFDDIYPHADLSISNVMCHTKYALDGSGQKIPLGSGQYDTYCVFYFQIVGFDYNPEIYNPVSCPSGMAVAGLVLTANFKTGQLRGRDFELEYLTSPRSCINVDGTRFTVPAGSYCINFIDENGFIIPAAALAPANGDDITLYNIRMPDDYVRTAQAELEEAALAHIATYEQDTSTYTVEAYKSAFAQYDPQLEIGSCVSLNKTLRGTLFSRVIKYEKHLDLPYEQTITIGNKRTKGAIRTLREQVLAANDELDRLNIITQTAQRAAQSLPRRFTDTRETMEALSQSMLEGFDSHISPITVQTMQLVAGSDTLQFNFTSGSSATAPTVPLQLTWNADAQTVSIPLSYLRHETLNLPYVSNGSYYDGSTAKRRWRVPAFTSDTLADTDKSYYLYVCARKYTGSGYSTSAFFLLSSEPQPFEEAVGSYVYYNLLCGILNSEHEGARSFSQLYGFTEILPGRIATSRITSADGQTFFDLDSGLISGNISFSSGSAAGQAVQNALGIASGAQTAASTAQTAASNAQTAASNARQIAEEAADNLADYGADDKISPTEKRALKQTKEEISSEYADIIADADKYNVSGTVRTNYTNAKTLALAALDKYTASVPEHIAVGSDYNHIAAYYPKRTAILDAIAVAAKKVATDAQAAADNALASLTGENLVIHKALRKVNISNVMQYALTRDDDGFYTRNPDAFAHAGLQNADWRLRLQTGQYILSWQSRTSASPNDGDCGIYRSADGSVACYEWHIGGSGQKAFTVSAAGEYFIIFKPSAQNGGMRIKLERGTRATPWSNAPADTNTALDYLQESLQAATQQHTTIDGGLILTTVLGVRETTGSEMVAGMNGSADADLPMIFSGRNSAALSNGTFQVWKDGRVESTDGVNGILIDRQNISFHRNRDPKNIITSDEAPSGGISGMVDASGGASTGSVTPKTLADSVSNDQYPNISMSYSTTVISNPTVLVSSPPIGGTLTFANNAAITAVFGGYLSVTIDDAEKSFSITHGISATVSVYVRRGNTDTVLYSHYFYYIKSMSSDLSFSCGGDDSRPIEEGSRTINFGANETVSLFSRIEISYSAENAVDPSETNYANIVRYTANASVSFSSISYTVDQAQYKNTMYADGMIMASAQNRYFGIDPKARGNGGMLLLARHGDLGLALTSNGLMQCSWATGSRVLTRMNPLVMIIRVQWDNTTLNKDVVYNPLNKTVFAQRNSQGQVQITHNINRYTLSFSGRVMATGDVGYVTPQYIDNNTVLVKISGFNSKFWDFPFELLIFDHSVY